MILLKLKYFLHYYKSKNLKKKSKKLFFSKKKEFLQKILHKNFSNRWFLNNFEIFNFFFTKRERDKI